MLNRPVCVSCDAVSSLIEFDLKRFGTTDRINMQQLVFPRSFHEMYLYLRPPSDRSIFGRILSELLINGCPQVGTIAPPICQARNANIPTTHNCYDQALGTAHLSNLSKVETDEFPLPVRLVRPSTSGNVVNKKQLVIWPKTYSDRIVRNSSNLSLSAAARRPSSMGCSTSHSNINIQERRSSITHAARPYKMLLQNFSPPESIYANKLFRLWAE